MNAGEPRVLWLFLDGVGLAPSGPHNPLAWAAMPTLQRWLGGRPLTLEAAPYDGPLASLRALDACLGVPGVPQSATGQAALLTGRNVPALVGRHEGPKPTPAVAAYLRRDTLFHRLRRAGRVVRFLNAYPPRYFEHLRSRRRLPGAWAMAALAAGLPLGTAEDLAAGRAVAPDFTGHGWQAHLDPHLTPLTPFQAGQRLARLAAAAHLSVLECWPTDVLGHRGDAEGARDLLARLDGVLAGLEAAGFFDGGLLVLTSDHGNLEDLSTRRHTTNPVPWLVVGPNPWRAALAQAGPDLTAVAPALERLWDGTAPQGTAAPLGSRWEAER